MAGSSSPPTHSFLSSFQSRKKYMGSSYCCFRCGIENHKVSGSNHYDGEWVWPRGLVHYVESHSVRLPEEFIETMRTRDWQPPTTHPQFGNPKRPPLRSIGEWCLGHEDHTSNHKHLPHPKSLVQPDWMKEELPLIIGYLKSSPDIRGNNLM